MADTFARYHCNYCEDNIIGLRIKCVECEDFDLCLQCFSSGAEIGKHRAGHDYQFMPGMFHQDTGQYSLFSSSSNNNAGASCSSSNNAGASSSNSNNGGAGALNTASTSTTNPSSNKRTWTAREDVRLLDAIEQYGYGNWEDICRHIETKTAEEARLKYIGFYIDGNIGKATWGPAMQRRQLPIEHNLHESSDPSSAPEGPLSPSMPSSLSTSGLAQFGDPTPEQCIALGCLPLRDDFEREWENEAECAVAPLFLHPTDDEDVDIALKLAQVDMYLRNLRERSRRKRVVRDFQLIQAFFKKEHDKQHIQPRKKHKDEKEVISDKLRGVSQFQTANEHYNLVQSLIKEKQLKTRIKELNRYRRNGIRHVEECYEYDTARARREKRKEARKKGAPWQPQTPTPPDTTTQLQASRPRDRSEEKNPKYSDAKKCTAPGIGVGKWLSESSSDKSSSSSNNNSNSSSNSQRSDVADQVMPLPDISSLPGYRLLSAQERSLCSRLSMKPAQYVSYKALALKESFESRHRNSNSSNSQSGSGNSSGGSGLSRKVWCPPGLDTTGQTAVHNYFTSAGWITSEG
ncbi:Zinc finger ZZ-type [Trinorchestia longiramus]|nr:Zinc finger ZZ-type [Trinorchestia longiramus]